MRNIARTSYFSWGGKVTKSAWLMNSWYYEQIINIPCLLLIPCIMHIIILYNELSLSICWWNILMDPLGYVHRGISSPILSHTHIGQLHWKSIKDTGHRLWLYMVIWNHVGGIFVRFWQIFRPFKIIHFEKYYQVRVLDGFSGSVLIVKYFRQNVNNKWCYMLTMSDAIC